MAFDELQNMMYGEGNILPDIPVFADDKYMNADWNIDIGISDKEDQEYRNNFNYFNYAIRQQVKDAQNISVLFKDGVLQVIDIFERDCQLPGKYGALSSSDKKEKYRITLALQDLYRKILNNAILKGLNTEQEYAQFLTDMEILYKNIMRIKNIKMNLIKAIKAAYQWLTSFQVNFDIANELPEYKLQNQIQIGKYLNELGITVSEDDIPSWKDVFHSMLGTGYFGDAYEYIKNNFYTT